MGGRRARAAVVLGLLDGCVSYGSHLSATPVPAGQDEVALSADVLVIDRGLGPQLLPNPEAAWRSGLGENMDLGARVNVGGVEANGRFRVLSSTLLELTLVPGVGVGFVPVTNADSGLFHVSALGAVLAGIELDRRNQLVIGARGMASYTFPLTAFSGDAAGAKVIYLVGGVLGVRLPVGESTYLFPDINVLVPYDSDRREWFFPNIQGGVSLQFE